MSEESEIPGRGGGVENTQQPTTAEVQEALNAVLASEAFRSAQSLREILGYLVQKKLDGEEDSIKAYSIAIDAMGRPADFDAQGDPAVRVAARRLRDALGLFYANEGRGAAWQIQIPKGTYIPHFVRQAEPPADQGDRSSPAGMLGHDLPNLSRVTWAGVIAVALVVTVLAWYGVASSRFNSGVGSNPSRIPAAASHLPSGPRIAVQPVLELWDRPERERPSRGLTVQLTHDLTRFRDLQVVAAQSTFNLHENRFEPSTSADYELFATVFVRGSSVQISAQLMALPGRRVIWSKIYKRTFSSQDVSAVFQVVSSEVAATLGSPGSVVTRAEAKQPRGTPTAELTAHRCVLAFYDYVADKTASGHSRQRHCLEEVVQKFPSFARAWSQLAWVYGDEIRYRYNTRKGAKERAIEAAKRAVSLDPSDAIAHNYLAESLLLDGNEDLARHHFDQALKLNPNDTDLLAAVAWQRAFFEDWENADHLSQKALRLNPSHPNWYRVVPYMVLFRRGAYREALTMVATRRSSESPLSHLGRLAAYAKLGQTKRAKQLLAELGRKYPGFATNLAGEFRRQRLPQSIAKLLTGVIADLNERPQP